MPDAYIVALQELRPLVVAIRDVHGTIETLIPDFRSAIDKAERTHTVVANHTSGPFWRHVAFVDSLIRVRLFVEQNFRIAPTADELFLEPMGLLAITRYLFELVVWLKLMCGDSRYGLVYYRELLVKQRHHYTDVRNHLGREITMLRQFDQKEKQLLDDELAAARAIPDPIGQREALGSLNSRVTELIDNMAAREFSLYVDQARANGYGFQAHLLEKKGLPQIDAALAAIEKELSAFDRNTASKISELTRERWEWKKQATRVGMLGEYEFIYSFTSRLLHATPSSLTTDKKNPETDELRVLLKYFHVRVLDVVDMAREVLANGILEH
jgi:hypothetical protein